MAATQITTQDWASTYLMNEGVYLHRHLKKDPLKTLHVLELAAIEQPFNSSILLLIGMGKRMLHHPAKARQDLEQARYAEGPSARLSAEIGLTYLDEKNSVKAREELEPICKEQLEALTNNPVLSISDAAVNGYLVASQTLLEATLASGKKPEAALKLQVDNWLQLAELDDGWASLLKENFRQVLSNGLTMAALYQFPSKLDSDLQKKCEGYLAVSGRVSQRRNHIFSRVDRALEPLRVVSPTEVRFEHLRLLLDIRELQGLVGGLLYRVVSEIKKPAEQWPIWLRLLNESSGHPEVRSGAVKALDIWARELDDKNNSELALLVWQLASEIDLSNPVLFHSLGVTAAKVKNEVVYRRSWTRLTRLMESIAGVTGDPAPLRASHAVRSKFYQEMGKARHEHELREAGDLVTWAGQGFLSCLDQHLLLHAGVSRLLQPPYLARYALQDIEDELCAACQAASTIDGTAGSDFRLSLVKGALKDIRETTQADRLASSVVRREMEEVQRCRKAWATFAIELFQTSMTFLNEPCDLSRSLDDYVALAILLVNAPLGLIKDELRKLADPEGTGEVKDYSELFRNNCIGLIFKLAQGYRSEESKRDIYNRLVDAAARINPNNSQVVMARAIARVEQKQDFAGALEIVETALSMPAARRFQDEERGQLRSLWGQVRSGLIGELMGPAITLMKKEDWEGALRELQRALQRFPKVAIVLFHVALCELKSGNLQAGKHHAEQALADENVELDLQEQIRGLLKNASMIAAELHMTNGQKALQTERHAEAKKAFEKAVDIVPHLAHGWYLLAIASFKDEDYDGADRAIEKAVELAEDPDAKKHFQETRDNLKKARFTASLGEAVGHMNSNNFKQALDSLRRVCERHPTNHLAWYYRAICEFKVKNYPEAMLAIDEAISKQAEEENKKQTEKENKNVTILKYKTIPEEYKNIKDAIQKSLDRGPNATLIEEALEKLNNEDFRGAKELLEQATMNSSGMRWSTSQRSDEVNFLLGFCCNRIAGNLVSTKPTGSRRDHFLKTLEIVEEGIGYANQVGNNSEFRDRSEDLLRVLKNLRDQIQEVNKPHADNIEQAISKLNDNEYGKAYGILSKIPEYERSDEVHFLLAVCTQRSVGAILASGPLKDRSTADVLLKFVNESISEADSVSSSSQYESQARQISGNMGDIREQLNRIL